MRKYIKRAIVPLNREPTDYEIHSLSDTEQNLQNDLQGALNNLKYLGKWSGGYESDYYKLKRFLIKHDMLWCDDEGKGVIY